MRPWSGCRAAAGHSTPTATPPLPAGRAAIAQSKATGESVEAVTSRFNGLFFTAFQVCVGGEGRRVNGLFSATFQVGRDVKEGALLQPYAPPLPPR